MIIKQDLNKAVFTLKQIISGQIPILYVVHDEDDEWQFLSGNTVAMEDIMIVSLQQIIDRDNSITQILNLPKGHKAARENSSSQWIIGK